MSLYKNKKNSYLAIKRLTQSIERLWKGNLFLVNHFAACEPTGATVHTFLRYIGLPYSGIII